MRSVTAPVGQRNRGKNRLIWAALALLLGLFIWWRHSGPPPRPHGGGAVVVGVAKASLGAMPVVLDELGTITPVTTVTVLPQISGYITAIGFTEGQVVKAGQFLVQIDPRPYQIQLEQYQAALAKDSASLAQGRSDLARYEKLLAQDSISVQLVADQRFLVAQEEAAIKADQANIDSAKLNLIYCHITAPIGGRVGLRLVDIGNYVTPGSSSGLAVITSISPTTAVFSVSQADLPPVLTRLGQGATLTATAYSSDDTAKLEDGTLAAVDSQIDTATGMVKLRAIFANEDGKLFANEFVNVHLLVNTLQNVTLVPNPAVQIGARGAYVYVVQPDDTVRAQPVATGPTDGVNTVITKGIAPGDMVVTDGVDRLADGMKVQPASPAGASPTGQAASGQHRHRPSAAAAQ
jgi:multidrug efflux system membrane fusion protein